MILFYLILDPIEKYVHGFGAFLVKFIIVNANGGGIVCLY